MKKMWTLREDVEAGGLLVFLLLCLTLCFPYFESTRNANERPRLMQGMALVDDGTFAIDGPRRRGLDPGPDVARSRVDGRMFPNKPPGASLVGSGAYVASRWLHEWGDHGFSLRDYTLWARLLGAALPALLVCWFMFRRYTEMFGRGPTTLAVVLYALGTPAASYAHLFYGHQLAACLLLVGVESLCGSQQHRRIDLARVGGVLAAAAVAVEYGAVFAALPVGLMLLFGLRGKRGASLLGWSLLCALVPIALLGWYHQGAFGSPFSTGYHHVVSASFAAKHGQGLLGLGWPTWDGFYTHVLSPDGGLLWWVPLFPLALYGLAQLAVSSGHFSREARVHLVGFLIFLVVTSGLVFDGGWRVGPRYMVVMLPVLTLGWANAFSQLRTESRWMPIVMLLATYSVLVNAMAANLWPHFDLDNVNQPVAEVLIPLVREGFEPYSLPRAMLDLPGSWAAVCLSLLGLWYAVFRLCETGVRMAIGLIVGAVIGFPLVTATAFVPAHPDGKRNLEYVIRVWEPPRDPGAASPRSMDIGRRSIASTEAGRDEDGDRRRRRRPSNEPLAP
jgi:hypothetical protein